MYLLNTYRILLPGIKVLPEPESLTGTISQGYKQPEMLSTSGTWEELSV